jgi:methylmalonyl-CoA mutase
MPDRNETGLSDFDGVTDFPVPDLEAWRAEAVAALGGASFEKKLLTPLPEGITLRPLYTGADTAGLAGVDSYPGEAPLLRGAKTLGHRLDPWEIVQELPYATPGELNQALRQDLAQGQTAAVLLFDAAARHGLDPGTAPAGEIGLGGTSIATLTDLDLALSGIDIEDVPVFLRAGAAALPAATLLAALLRHRGQDATRLRGSIGADPVAEALAAGTPFDIGQLYDDLAVLTAWADQQASPVKTLAAWGARWHDAGANAVEELAWTLASAVQTLRAMEARGLPPAKAAARFLLGFAVGSRFLVEIAKLRAARLLWARVTEACGCPETAGSVFLLARTAMANLSAIDPHTNILRTTTEALSAVLGGCDGLTVLPYDRPLGLPSQRARRVARNTHLILREESRFDRVIDAAGGAWALESLTSELAERAWRLFRDVESEGGLCRLLETGRPQARVAEAAEGRRKAIASRREILVGVNQYPNLGEPAPIPQFSGVEAIVAERVTALRRHRDDAQHVESERLLHRVAALAGRGRSDAAAGQVRGAGNRAEIVEAAVEAALGGATLGELSTALHPVPGPSLVRFPPLPVRRLSDDFSALRIEVHDLRTAAESRGEIGPEVFLANIGPHAAYLLRLEFTRSFFALAGFSVESDGQFDDPDSAAEAAARCGARVVCIVSSDDRYPKTVPVLADALKRACPGVRVLVTGLPTAPERVEAWRGAGIDEFIHLRGDAHAILAALAGHIRGEKK